jgi:hypothetical protein
MVYAADRAGLRRAYERAMARGVERLAVFTQDLFATPNDQADRGAVASVPAAELDFASIALHADRKTVDKVIDRLRAHPNDRLSGVGVRRRFDRLESFETVGRP